jgi:hypothetical protein
MPRRIDLVRTDDPEACLFALLVFEQHPCAEEDARLVVRRTIDDLQAFEPLAQETHAPVDFTQLPLAVDLFGVFGPVALGRRLLHGARDLWPHDFP